MGVTVLDDSCGGATEINILLVSNQYFSQLKAEEEKKIRRLWLRWNMDSTQAVARQNDRGIYCKYEVIYQ